ncbi:MAG: oligosaccharide flippase family protein [Flavobacteriales bacterium]|nr:oligosaccharide flippase family protein [Flavobacteriales bacterium]
MRKKFLSNVILIVFINLLIKPLWIFLIDRGVQNNLGQVDYGSFFALFNFTYIFQILLDLGITNFNNKRIAQNTKVLNKYFSGLVKIKFGLGLVYIIIALSTGLILNYSAGQFKILLLLCINQFLLLFILFLRSNISGQMKFRAESLFSVMDKVLMILICGAMLYIPMFKKYLSIESFVLAQTASYVLTAFAAWLTALKGQKKITLHFSKAFVISTLKSSLPYALLVFLMSVYNKVGPVILERFYDNGKELTGYFAQSYRILDAYMMISILFINLLYPLFSNLLHQKKPVNGIMSMSLRLLLVPTLLLIVIGFFYGQELMEMLYWNNTENVQRQFFLVICISLPILMINIFGTLLTANGNLKQLNWISFGAVLINVLLCFLLRGWFKGDLSIAIALLVSQSFAALAQVYLVFKKFNLKPVSRLSLKILSYLCIICGLAYGLSFLNYGWIIQVVILSLFALLTASIFKILSYKEIKSWLSQSD